MLLELSPEQVARFPEFVEKWTKIGLSTDPVNHPAAEAAINDVYECGGLPSPKQIIWCGSPLSMVLTREALERSVSDSVRDSVRDSVWDSVRDSVWDSVRVSVSDSVRDSVRASVRDSIYGSHESDWLSFYDFFGEACGLNEKVKGLQGLFDLAKTTGWILPFKDVCLASEKPNVLHLDDRGKIHCLTGPAIKYTDGFKIYAIGGRLVTERLIERPWEVTFDEINAETDPTMQRFMKIGRTLGWDR